MHHKDIKIGKTYAVKVSGRVVPVKIESTSIYGGWNGRNTKTNRIVRIKSAQKLRYEATTDEGGKT